MLFWIECKATANCSKGRTEDCRKCGVGNVVRYCCDKRGNFQSHYQTPSTDISTVSREAVALSVF